MESYNFFVSGSRQKSRTRTGPGFSALFSRHNFHHTKGNRNRDRKSTRLNSSHGYISYAVFCLKKKKIQAHLVRRDTDALGLMQYACATTSRRGLGQTQNASHSCMVVVHASISPYGVVVDSNNG